MGNGLQKRDDLFGTVLVNEKGMAERVLTRCPHCGMVDYRFSSQGLKSSHFANSRVGGVRKYQCGKCRNFFHTLEIQVPLDMDPMKLYEKINKVFGSGNTELYVTKEK